MRISQLAAQKARALLDALEAAPPALAAVPDPRPEMLCFRGQTPALIRHFFEISSQVGRVSSLLGREFFRSRVSHHAIPSFEEQAVFVRDVELCLARLSDEQLHIVTLVGLYDFTLEEVGAMLQSSRAAVHQWFSEAVDALSEIFLAAGLLREDRPDRRQQQSMQNPLPPDRTAPPKKPPQSVQIAPSAATAPRRAAACRLRIL